MDVDLLIRGGTVVDGTGAPGVVADVAVRDGRIAAVGTLPDAAAATVIDATGRIVAPGFIDAHPHSETALRGNGEIWGSVLQGVTSHLTGPDGFGWAPLPAEACAELWRATAFAYGQPDLRPDWPTIDAYLDGFAGHDPAQRRADGAAPADPLRGHGLGRSPADAGRDGPDARPHPRLDGGRRGRAQHRARLPAGGQRVHGRDRRAGQGRRRVRRRLRRPHPLQRDRQAGRLPRVDRDRPARGRPHPAVARVGRRRDRAAARGGPPGRRRLRHRLVPLPGGVEPPARLAAAGGPARRLRRDRQAPARRPGPPRQDRAPIIEEQIGITHAIGGREYFSDTRTGRYIGMSIARGRRASAARAWARRRST